MRLGALLVLVLLCGHATAQPVQPAPPRSNDYALNFLPFGGGQFRNCQPLKGAAFAISQTATATISFGLFAYLVGKYSIQNDRVPVEDGPTVRRLQQIEIASGLAFFGLYTWGVIDSFIHYGVADRRCNLVDASRGKPRRVPVVVAPSPISSGAGLSFSWSR